MKKPLVIVGIVVGALVLLIALFVGGIAGITFYSIYHSDAAETARGFLRANEKLKQEIGEVKEFSRFISGRLNTGSSGGQATLVFKVYGERKTVTATVILVAKETRGWRVVSAEYINENGRRITLFDPYEPVNDEPEPVSTEPEPAAPPTP